MSLEYARSLREAALWIVAEALCGGDPQRAERAFETACSDAAKLLPPGCETLRDMLVVAALRRMGVDLQIVENTAPMTLARALVQTTDEKKRDAALNLVAVVVKPSCSGSHPREDDSMYESCRLVVFWVGDATSYTQRIGA